MTDEPFELLGEPGTETVELVAYDAGWPAGFEAMKARVVEAVGDVARRVDHVGSTAIPGLIAKPVIDMQLSVDDYHDEGAYAPALATLGLTLRARSPGHRYFRPPTGEPRLVHLHVCDLGSDWERRHLLFRDYLRSHAERAAMYSALKAELALEYHDDRLAYTDGKTAFVDETLALAERWASRTGWSP